MHPMVALLPDLRASEASASVGDDRKPDRDRQRRPDLIRRCGRRVGKPSLELDDDRRAGCKRWPGDARLAVDLHFDRRHRRADERVDREPCLNVAKRAFEREPCERVLGAAIYKLRLATFLRDESRDRRVDHMAVEIARLATFASRICRGPPDVRVRVRQRLRRQRCGMIRRASSIAEPDQRATRAARDDILDETILDQIPVPAFDLERILKRTVGGETALQPTVIAHMQEEAERLPARAPDAAHDAALDARLLAYVERDRRA